MGSEPIYYDEPPPDPNRYGQSARKPARSGLGVASFVTSIVAVIVLFAMFGLAWFANQLTPGGLKEGSLLLVILDLTPVTVTGVSVIALGLGICGYLEDQRRPGFAVAGTIISALFLGSMVVLMIASRMMR